MIITFLTALALTINGHVPTKSDLGIKETPIIYEEQTKTYDLTDKKKRKK